MAQSYRSGCVIRAWEMREFAELVVGGVSYKSEEQLEELLKQLQRIEVILPSAIPQPLEKFLTQLCPQIQVLVLVRCELSRIANLGGLPHLTVLNLKENKLRTLQNMFEGGASYNILGAQAAGGGARRASTGSVLAGSSMGATASSSTGFTATSSGMNSADVNVAGNMRKLREIYLCSNLFQGRLSRSELRPLRRVTRFWISRNSLTTAKNLGQLRSAKELNLAGNRIECVTTIDVPKGVQQLNLAHNKIRNFTDVLDLKNLPSLRELHLSDPDYGENPICQLCNYGVALVQYFKQLELVDLQSIDVEMVRESDAIWKRKRLYYDMQAESVTRQGDNAVQIARAFFLEQRRNLLNEVLPKLYHELQLVLQETCSPSVAEKIFAGLGPSLCAGGGSASAASATSSRTTSGSPLKSLPSSATTTPTTTALDVGLLLDIDTISRSGTSATGRTTKQELNATEKYAVTLAKRYVQVRDFLLPELQRHFAGFESSMHKVVDKEVQSIQRELALGGNIHFQLPKREEQTSIATKCSASMDDAAEFDAAFSSSSSSSSSCEHAGVRETPSTSDLESSAVAPPAGEVAVSSSASVVPSSGTTSTDEPASSTSSKGKGGAGKQVMTAPPVIQASSVEGYEWERMVEYLVRVSWENFKAEEFRHVNTLQVSRVSKIHANNGSPLFPFLHGGSGAAPGAIGGSTAAAASSSLSQESHFSKSLALSRKGTEWGKKLAEELREDRNAGESEKQSKYLFMVLPIGEGSASSGSSSSSCPSFGSTAEFYGARRRTTASGLFTSGGSSSSSAKISGGGPVAGTASGSGQHQNKLDHDHEGLEAAPAWFSATAGTSNSTTATTTSLQDMVANWRSTDTTQVLQRRRQLLQTEEMRLKKMSYSTSASGSAAAWFNQIAAAGGRSRPTSAGASVRSRPGTSSRKSVGGAAGAAGETKGEDHGDGETEINHHQDSSSCSESLTVDEQEQILAMQQTEKEIEAEKALKIEARFQRILKSGNVGVREDNLMSRDTPSRAKGRHGNGDQQFSTCSAIDSEYGGGTGANVGSRPVTHAERKRQEQRKREEMINEWTQSVTKQLHEAVRESGGEVFAPDEAEQLFLTLEGGGGGNAGGGVGGSPGGYGRAGAAGSRPGTVSNNSALQATSALLTSQNWSPYATEFCVFLTNSVAVALYPVLQQFAESDFAQSVFGGEQLDRMSCSQKSSRIGSADSLKKRYLGGAELLVCQAFGMQNELPDVADPFFHYQKESGGASSFGRSTSLAGGGGSSFSSVSGAAGGPSSSPGYDVPGAPPPAGGTMQNLSNASSFQTASNVRPSTRAPPCGLFSRHHYLFPAMDSEQTYVSRYGLLKRPAQQLPGSSIQIDSLLKANGAHVAQAQAWARRAKPPGGSLGGDPDERPPTTPSSPSPTGRKSRTMLNKKGVGLALPSSVVASSGGASGRATGPEQREQPPPLTGSASPTTGTASGCSPPASPTKSKERAVELAVRTLNTFSLESDGYIDPLRGCGRTTSGASSSSSSAGAGGEGPDGSPLLEPPAMSNFEREWKKLQEAKSARDEEAQGTAASPAPKVETTRSGSGQHESHLFHSFARSKSLQEFLSSPGYDSVSGRYRTLDSDPRQKIWRFRDASRCEPAFLLQLEFVYDSETEKIECNLVGKNADVGGDATSKVQTQEKILSCSAESVQPTATSLPGDHDTQHTSSTTTASGTEMVATVPPFSGGASSSSLRASSSSSSSSFLGVPSSSSDPKLLTKIYEKWLGRQVNSTSEELIKRDFGLFWPRLREFAFLVTTVFAHTLAERVLTRSSASAAYDVFFETASGALPSHFRPTTTPSVNFNQKTVFDHMTNSHPLGSHTRTHFRVGQFSSAEDLASAWDLGETSDSRTVTQRATLERAVLRERQRILLSLHRVESAQIESITYVNLWGANLRRLSKDCFVGLHKLKTLVLGMNRFVSAAEDLGSSWSCEIVDLSWNFLKPSSRPSSSSICTSSTASEQRPSTSQTERRLFPNCKRLHLTGNAEFHLGTLLHTAAIAEGGLNEWAPKVEELFIDVPEGVFESGSGAVGGHLSRGSCNPYHSAEMQRLLVATHPSLKLVNSMKIILLITNSVVQPPQVVTATAASAVADHDELGGGHKNDASRAAVGLSLGFGGDSADVTENAASASASSDPFRPAAFPTPGGPRAGGGAGKSGCHLSLSPLKEGDGSRIQTSVLGVSGGSPTRRRSPAKDLLSGAVSGGAGGGTASLVVRENSNSVGDVSLNASRKTLNVTQMVQQHRAKMQARYSSSAVLLSSSASSSDGRSAAMGAGEDVQPNLINNDVPCRSSDEEEDASPDDDADLPAFLCSVLDLADGDEKTSYPRPRPCATAATDFFFQNLQHLIVSNIGLVSLQSSSSFSSSTAPSYSISQLCVAQRLETLDISCNKLQSLKGLEAFRLLKRLDASQNAIYCDVLPSLPAGLEFLNLSQNCVKSLAFQVVGDRNTASADHFHTVGIAAPTSYPGLRALYLGDNLLSDMRELQVLPRLFPKLAILELRGNPMCLSADSSVSRDLLDRALSKSCAELVARKRGGTAQAFKKSIEQDAGGEEEDAAVDEPGSSVSQPQPLPLAYYEGDEDQLLENSEDSSGQLSPSSSSDGAAGDDHGAPKAFTSLEERDGEGEEGPQPQEQEGDNLNDEGHADQSTTFFDDSCTRLEDRTLRKQKREERHRQREQDRLAKQKAKRESQALAKPIGRGDVMPKVGMDYSYAASLSSGAGTSRPSSSSSASLSLEVMQKAAGARANDNADRGGRSKMRTKAASMTAEDLREQELGRNVWGTERDAHVEHDLQKFFPTERADGRSGSFTSASAAAAAENDANAGRAGEHAHAPDLLEGADVIDLQLKLAPADDQRREHQLAPADPRGVRNRNHLRVSKLYRLSLIYLLRDSLQYLDGMSITDAELKAAWQTFRTTLTPDLLLQQSGCFYHAKLRALTALNLTSAKLSDLSDGILSDRWLPQLKYLSLDNNVIRTGRIGPLRKLLSLKMNRCCVGELSRFVRVGVAAVEPNANRICGATATSSDISGGAASGAGGTGTSSESSGGQQIQMVDGGAQRIVSSGVAAASSSNINPPTSSSAATTMKPRNRSIFFDSLPKLQHLELSYNQLRSATPFATLGEQIFSELRVLVLAHNQITALAPTRFTARDFPPNPSCPPTAGGIGVVVAATAAASSGATAGGGGVGATTAGGSLTDDEPAAPTPAQNENTAPTTTTTSSSTTLRKEQAPFRSLKKLRALILNHNKIRFTDAFSFFQEQRINPTNSSTLHPHGINVEAPALEEIFLTHNRLSSLDCFSAVKNLKLLKLDFNRVSALEAIQLMVPRITVGEKLQETTTRRKRMVKMEELLESMCHTISLARNPVARKPFYRFTLCQHLAALEIIDGRKVTQEDRLGYSLKQDSVVRKSQLLQVLDGAANQGQNAGGSGSSTELSLQTGVATLRPELGGVLQGNSSSTEPHRTAFHASPSTVATRNSRLKEALHLRAAAAVVQQTASSTSSALLNEQEEAAEKGHQHEHDLVPVRGEDIDLLEEIGASAATTMLQKTKIVKTSSLYGGRSVVGGALKRDQGTSGGFSGSGGGVDAGAGAGGSFSGANGNAPNEYLLRTPTRTRFSPTKKLSSSGGGHR